MPTLDPDGGFILLVNTFRVKAGRADDLLALLTRATEDTVQHVAGYISADLHVSLDRRYVANYARWHSKADFDNAMRAPQFQAHMKDVEGPIESFNPVLYELRSRHGNRHDGIMDPRTKRCRVRIVALIPF